MKSFGNIIGILLILFGFGVFDKIDIPFPFPVIDPIIVEISKPNEEYVLKTIDVSKSIPVSAKIDLAVFNDEFSKRILTYKNTEITNTQLLSKIYPKVFREVFGTKYSGQLENFLDKFKIALGDEIVLKEKFLSNEDLDKISFVCNGIAWNLINPEKK